MTQVSVIIPTLNEAANLTAVVEEVSQGLGDANLTHEIIVVDDASTDGTPRVARDLAVRWPVRLIERHAETGLSTAVVAGMRQATGEVFAVLDADGSHPAGQVAELASCVQQNTADIAIGSRYVSGGRVAAEWPWTRRLTSRLASMAARPLVPVRDPLAGMFAISRRVFDDVRPQIRPRGFKILLEIFTAAQDTRVVELPIQFRDRIAGQSKLTGRVALGYLHQLERLYRCRMLRGIGRFLPRRTGGRLATGKSNLTCASLPPPASSLRSDEKDSRLSLATLRRSRRAGFTLVELLAVIAIVGLLIALLLPAVQAAREAARRATCASKLRNLALAVQNYHEAHNGYPRNRFKVPRDVGPDGRSWSWIARVLPFIEEQSLYDQLDVRRATLGERDEFIARPLDFLLCPSDGGPRNRLGSGHFEEMPMGVTNYKAVCGANWGADETQDLDDIGSRWRNIGFNGSYDGQAHGDGIMWRDDYTARMRAAKVTDGLSKTFLLGEDVPRFNAWNAWGYNTNTFATCSIPLNTNDAHPKWWPDSMGFRSRHSGHSVFALGDASVRHIHHDIDAIVYRALATRRGHAKLSHRED